MKKYKERELKMKVKMCISIDKKIAESLKTFCEENGYKISNLIEMAVKEKIEKSKEE